MSIRNWLISFSPTTLTSAFSSVTLGTALAWYLNNKFNPIIYVITLAALLLAQAGVNLVHDYYDYLSGVDILYRASGFSHRPHPIIDLKLSPRDVITVGYVFLAIAFMAGGVYLFTLVGWPVLILAMAGLIIGVGYSIPPLKFHYRGYGEVLAALAWVLSLHGGAHTLSKRAFTQTPPRH
ncbi:prenyltransferase [Vulcanisaeta distributa]|uniref:prenyltransferase n=1 Tax=Vulcanisaeta distributa TaxID=164451 RepID=UPI000AB7443B|nr:prenyltransferase [Vulcanisaeta distributa]